MDGLPAEELAQLSSLFDLRNALYSAEFRQFLQGGYCTVVRKEMRCLANSLNRCHGLWATVRFES